MNALVDYNPDDYEFINDYAENHPDGNAKGTDHKSDWINGLFDFAENTIIGIWGSPKDPYYDPRSPYYGQKKTNTAPIFIGIGVLVVGVILILALKK